jgi:hypothetical protein
MDSDYVFLCGVMWCRYGQQDAGSELLRAVKSADPDLSALALAMLVKGCASLQEQRNVNEPFARDKEEITAPLGSQSAERAYQATLPARDDISAHGI